jgi:hypothetical protein
MIREPGATAAKTDESVDLFSKPDCKHGPGFLCSRQW